MHPPKPPAVAFLPTMAGSACFSRPWPTGKLQHVYVEMFDHEDAGLEMLRTMEPGHGIDTRDGRNYTEVMADGLGDIAHRLNNLAARGILKS
jgi:hypothetical protein